MKLEFWKQRRIAITGHTGFMGGWLVATLRRLEATISGFALDVPTQPSLWETAGLSDTPTAWGDIRNLEALRSFLAESKPDVVIHLAAQPLVRRSYDRPLETFETNVIGTANLFEAVREVPSVRAVLNVTSDKCYENRSWPWPYREQDALGGHDPYSSSKACAELVTEAYRKSFLNGNTGRSLPISVATARAGNVIGGGDWATDRLIPDMIRAVYSGQAVLLRNPEAVRPWQHVLEAISGYLVLLEKMWESPNEFAQAFNFGPTEESCKPVSWVADKVLAAWGGGRPWQVDSSRQPHEATLLKVDSSKAKNLLGWEPRWTLEKAIEATVLWYKSAAAGEEIAAVTARQIDEFLRLSPASKPHEPSPAAR
jgi:CDP-glucose 4,6-dehydratase